MANYNFNFQIIESSLKEFPVEKKIIGLKLYRYAKYEGYIFEIDKSGCLTIKNSFFKILVKAIRLTDAK